VRHKTSSAYGIFIQSIFLTFLDENTSLPIEEETNKIYTKNPKMSTLKCCSTTGYVSFKWIQCENTRKYTGNYINN